MNFEFSVMNYLLINDTFFLICTQNANKISANMEIAISKMALKHAIAKEPATKDFIVKWKKT